MAADAMQVLVKETLEGIDAPVTFDTLVRIITPEGDCLECTGNKVKRALAKLIEEGQVTVGADGGYA